MFDYVPDGCTKIADYLKVILDVLIVVHIYDAVADVLEIVTWLQPLIPVFFEVIPDRILCMLTESDE